MTQQTQRNSKDYRSMKLVSLRMLAQRRLIVRWADMTHEKLVEALENCDR
jgi:hypothetical protein